MIGLYVHIPFCIRKCHYCNFVIAPSDDDALRERYLEALRAEAQEARRRYGALHFDTVYLGGGTPSALSIEETGRVLEILRQNFSWKPQAEFTIEVNPGEVDASKLRRYREWGMNRISLGVQSTQDRILQSLNRAHDAVGARRTARLALEAGFENISMDLMLRLPNQKMEDLVDSLRDVVEWKAQQIVIYDLCVHDKTHFGQKQKRGELPLPSEKVHEDMFCHVEKYLGEAGYEHYEVSSFARPGFQSRHNLIYWRNQPYLGLGPGAFSYIEGVRYCYALSVQRYIDKALRGDWSRDEEDFLGPEDVQMETFLTGLRLAEGIDLEQVPNVRAHLEAPVPRLAAQGLVEYDGSRLRLTPKGRRLAESVFVQFIKVRQS